MNGILIPQNIFAGDTAQYLFLLSEQETAELAALNFTTGIPIPLTAIMQNDMMTVKEMQIVKRENEHYLLITFTPWETGDINFPSLPFLKSRKTLPSIHVSSLLSGVERGSLQPPKPPVLLPGTDYLLYGIAAIGIGSLLLSGTGMWILIRRLQKKSAQTAKKRLSVLRKQLKKLHKEARKIQKYPIAPYVSDAKNSKNQAALIEKWYAAVDYSLREYLWVLCTENDSTVRNNKKDYFLSATYPELMNRIEELFTPQRSILDLFHIFYAALEKQRFGSKPSDLLRDYAAASQDMLKKLPYIAEKTEAAYRVLLETRKATAYAAVDV